MSVPNHGIPDSNFKPSLSVIDHVTHTIFAAVGDSNLGTPYIQIVDNTGVPIVSFGGGTQYTDAGASPTNPIGNALEYVNGSGAWQTVNSTHGLPVNIIGGLANPLPVSGTFWQATQPVSGTFWQSTQPVSIATMPSTPVTGTFWQATQPVSGTVTANAGTNLNTSLLALESGGNLATLAGIVSSAKAAVKMADGDLVTLGNKADAKSTATDTTAVSMMSVLKEISAMAQAPASTPVTGTFWQSTQPVSLASLPALAVGSALIGKVGIDQTTPGTTNGTSLAQINAATTLAGNGATGTGSQRVTIANDNTGIANWGQGATGSAVPSGAQYDGGIAKTALPSAASDGNLTGKMVDKYGRQIVVNETVRDLKADAPLTLSATTTETTLIAQTASVFNDITGVIVNNTSATAVRVDFRDTTGGSVRFPIYVPAGDVRGFSNMFFGQATVNTNWTAQCSVSVTDVRITATYIKNK